jgi:tripartite-type tricarboxylate transporter receptor subunit TctC
MVVWLGVMAPADTPPAVVRKLNLEFVKALQDTEIQSRLAQQGAEPSPSTPEEYGAYIRKELERWTGVFRSTGIKLDD